MLPYSIPANMRLASITIQADSPFDAPGYSDIGLNFGDNMQTPEHFADYRQHYFECAVNTGDILLCGPNNTAYLLHFEPDTAPG